MTDASIILEKIRSEIKAYEKSRAASKKILYEKCTAEIVANLHTFLEIILKDEGLEEMNSSVIKNKLFDIMEWDDS